MKLSELNLKKGLPEINIVKVDGQDIEVYSEISPIDEHDIIFTVLQKSFVDGYYSPYLINMYLTIYLITCYTNIELTQEDWEDVPKLYELFMMSGLAEEVLNVIGEDTIKETLDMVNAEAAASEAAKLSLAAQFTKYVEQFPALMQQASDIVANFDPEKFQNVIDFAEAGNGNRPIPQK